MTVGELILKLENLGEDVRKWPVIYHCDGDGDCEIRQVIEHDSIYNYDKSVELE